MQRLLIQTQLSNYDTKGNFILECDSGFQMVMGRVREMLKLNPELDITVMGPNTGENGNKRQLITDPWDVNPDLWEKYGDEGEKRLHYFEHEIIANALVTRYDFDWTALAISLDLGMMKLGRTPKYDAVYINDPMHLRNFQALFHVVAGYQPRFYVHSHFIDNPECPKFPKEASLWLGQCEAAIKADFNFWQCESAMNIFFESMAKQFQPSIVEAVKAKSLPWDDGYSQTEINVPVIEENLRFDSRKFENMISQKIVIFVPNRIGGKGRSSDYTNCGKFMFDLLPELRKRRQDFVIIAGNPNQKFLNSELEQLCGANGYINIVPNALNRDEFKYVARKSHIVLGLYDQDAYGGTASRECVELGCMPLWLDINEYSSIAREAGGYPYMVKPNWSGFTGMLSHLMDDIKHIIDVNQYPSWAGKRFNVAWQPKIQQIIRNRCSYEATSYAAMERMGLLNN